MGCGLEPYQRHCVVSLSKTLNPPISTGSTQEDLSRHDWKIVDLDIKNQNKQKSSAYPKYWFNPRKVPAWLRNCWLKSKATNQTNLRETNLKPKAPLKLLFCDGKVSFWVTVKAVTLIFLSWAWFGYFICSRREIRFYLFCKGLISCLSGANVHAFHENCDRIYIELTFINLKAHITKSCMLFSLKYLKPLWQTV